MQKRKLSSPWPFLYSVTSKGLVQNVQPKPVKFQPSKQQEAPF